MTEDGESQLNKSLECAGRENFPVLGLRPDLFETDTEERIQWNNTFLSK